MRRLVLTDFMAHAHTVFEFAPGLTVLTGPNNTGKSAVVEGLRCLAQNPTPRHCIRHGAREARVSAEFDDGTVVTWVRRPKYALYELTRPGAEEPEVYAKFGRTPPEDILDVLRLSPVPIEGGDPVDVHIGNQREPVFLLNQPGSALSGFFAASTEAAHLIAMQNLLTDRTRKAKTEKNRLDKELASLAASLDTLSPLPELELRLEQAVAAEGDIAGREREASGLADWLARRRELAGSIDRCERSGTALSRLAGPPELAPTAPLAGLVAARETLARRMDRAGRRGGALASLAAPPALVDTAGLAGRVRDLVALRGELARTEKKAAAVAGLAPPGELADVAGLGALVQDLKAVRGGLRCLDGRAKILSRLSGPPETADLAPLAALADSLQAARRAVSTARTAAVAKARALEELTSRIADRLAALGSCPLCGGALTPDDFLGAGHGHGTKPEGAS
ncbi:MAG: AAA family ATPase [Desulfovibrio sp.]